MKQKTRERLGAIIEVSATALCVCILLLAIGALVSALPYQDREAERRMSAVRAAGEKEVLPLLELEVKSVTLLDAKCLVDDPFFIELVEGKTYRAVVVCRSGKGIFTTAIDITRFGADDELYWKTDGLRPGNEGLN